MFHSYFEICRTLLFRLPGPPRPKLVVDLQFAILLAALTHFSSATMLLGKKDNIFNVFKVFGVYSNANDLDFKVTSMIFSSYRGNYNHDSDAASAYMPYTNGTTCEACPATCNNGLCGK
jgi:hypothetical protein